MSKRQAWQREAQQQLHNGEGVVPTKRHKEDGTPQLSQHQPLLLPYPGNFFQGTAPVVAAAVAFPHHFAPPGAAVADSPGPGTGLPAPSWPFLQCSGSGWVQPSVSTPGLHAAQGQPHHAAWRTSDLQQAYPWLQGAFTSPMNVGPAPCHSPQQQQQQQQHSLLPFHLPYNGGVPQPGWPSPVPSSFYVGASPTMSLPSGGNAKDSQRGWSITDNASPSTRRSSDGSYSSGNESGTSNGSEPLPCSVPMNRKGSELGNRARRSKPAVNNKSPHLTMLAEEFKQNPNPSIERMGTLAREMSMDLDKVRAYFFHQRFSGGA